MRARAGVTRVFEKVALGYPFFLERLSLYYEKRVGMELEAASISYGDRALCIGGGPCPFTAVYIHKFTGAHVTAIDNKLDAVQAGNRFINKLNLRSAITFIHAEGEKVALDGFSLVHVALQVTPREKVIRHIQKCAAPHTQIIVRGVLPEQEAVLEPGWKASRIEGLAWYPTLVLSRY
jgi:D-arabinose 1-dehydrogenase-like Zn-dependent alcohol dehydrogenase